MECQNLLTNLQKLLGPDKSEFVDHPQNIAKVHVVCNAKQLDIDEAKSVLDQFSDTWDKLRDKFDLSESLKIHIIKHHLFDTFELTGESLLKATDEITEATHSALRIHDERHGYKVNNKGSEAHIKKQHKSTVSFNSRNVGDC